MSGTWISAAAGSAAGVAWFLDSLVTTSPATPTVRALLSGTESDECSSHAESDPGSLDPSAEVPIPDGFGYGRYRSGSVDLCEFWSGDSDLTLEFDDISVGRVVQCR